MHANKVKFLIVVKVATTRVIPCLKDFDLPIGTWNVRTFHRVGAFAQLADVLIKW